MKWSLKLGEIAGIRIYMHWTFLILVGWIFIGHLSAGHSMPLAVQGVAFILALFACVVLHELGHALTARRYGIQTRDITLLPIGGVARLERMPREPNREFWIAIAGPAVNVVIAAGLLLGLLVAQYSWTLRGLLEVGGNFAGQLMLVNVFLVLFNLLPAFPMDGGRILRAVLASRMPYERATGVAARIGQGMAILFAFASFIVGNIFLLLIGVFVFIGAEAEARAVQFTSSLRGVRVGDAMIRHFRTLSAEDSLAEAVNELIAGSQQDFPVLDGERVVGILARGDLVKALSEGGVNVKVGSVMRTDCAGVEEDALLERTFERLRQNQCSTLPVLRDGRLVGLITLENIGELVMVNSAMQQVEV